MKEKTTAASRSGIPWAPINEVSKSAVAKGLKDIIREEAVRLCAQKYGSSLKSIILTGSLARDEGSFERQGPRWNLLGDVEFLLVFDPRNALPEDQQISALQHEITEGLSRRDLNCRVSLAAVHPTYLRRLRPHIFAYELRTCGQVVWGDARLLSLIPNFAPSDIPSEDAWRLLCNRMIEMLEVADHLDDEPKQLPETVIYRTVKLYLDMATSLLVFVGAYEPTYRARAERLRLLAEDSAGLGKLPFYLPPFADRVTACTRWKLFGCSFDSPTADLGQNSIGWAFWADAVEQAKSLWRWELEQMTHTQGRLSNHELLRKWMALQTLGPRLRGWLHALRKQGWRRSRREWPRWVRCAWRASPRHWIYGVASELFFLLPDLVRNGVPRTVGEVQWEELRRWLPVVGRARERQDRFRWQELAKEVVSNYAEFLVDTRW